MQKNIPGIMFLYILCAVLIGYAFLNKPFAYVGVYPIHVGEFILIIGLLIMLISGVSRSIMKSPIVWLLLAFMSWGAFNTIRSIPEHGLASMRDSVVWGYGVFSLIVASVVRKSNALGKGISWYKSWVGWFVVWVPVIILVQVVFQETLNDLGGVGLFLARIKVSDYSVHLAGAAAFLLLGLFGGANGERTRWSDGVGQWVLWVAIIISIVILASKTRAGMLVILTTVGVVLVLRARVAVLAPIVIGGVALLMLGYLDLTLPLGRERYISLQQITSNFMSIFIDIDRPELQGTIEWRVNWWRDIVDYTVFGEHFWFGKGYGVNLADSDGYQVIWDGAPLRSPHSSHMTMLARSGVPGFILWCLLTGGIGVSLVKRYRFNRRRSSQRMSRINLWMMAYWVAFVINMSFDVYLEGPQGGVWYWCLVGYIIAALQSEKDERVKYANTHAAYAD